MVRKKIKDPRTGYPGRLAQSATTFAATAEVNKK
jgi:hypothetical protein